MIARVGAVLLIAIVAGAVPAGSQSVPSVEKKSIGLAAAKKMVAAAEAEARKNKWAISISVVDDGGNLVYFERMDERICRRLRSSREGAHRRRVPDGDQRVRGGAVQRQTQLLSLPNASELQGGLPALGMARSSEPSPEAGPRASRTSNAPRRESMRS